jgi:hypothetical protein
MPTPSLIVEITPNRLTTFGSNKLPTVHAAKIAAEKYDVHSDWPRSTNASGTRKKMPPYLACATLPGDVIKTALALHLLAASVLNRWWLEVDG